MSITGTTSINYQNTVYNYVSRSTTSTDNSGSILKESVVDGFKMKHPDRARHVNQQVKAGRAFLEKNGLDSSQTANMTMEEYQAYIYALIDKIPYDSTRPNDTTIVSITDRGWEQMCSDPEYEAWIIGYLVEDRSVRNPFYAWGNDAGNVISEHFGASINEHIGKSFSKAVLEGDDNDNDEEDWFIKRHKRIKKLIKEQVERTMKKNALQTAVLQEEYARQQFLSARRQTSFLTTGTVESQPELATGNSSAFMAAAAYTGTLDLFGAAMPPTIDL